MSEPPITREQIREVTAAWWLPPRAVLESVAARLATTTAGRPVVMAPELMEPR